MSTYPGDEGHIVTPSVSFKIGVDGIMGFKMI